ncbi:putative ABC transporter binding protein NosD [Phycisphaerales bacterium]|nr:putative ABC transporter binding protein NosD [Phycisphaerales bacterium]
MRRLNAITAVSLLAAASAFGQAAGTIGRRIADARPGDTVVVPAGVHREHLRIDKPLKLVGEPGAILDGGQSGDIIDVTAPDVEIRGLTIRATGIDLDKENAAVRVSAARVRIEDNVFEDVLFGIDLKEAPDAIIRGNRIGGKDLDIARRGDGLRLWRSNAALIENNVIHDGRDAILWYSTGVVVRNNRSFRCRYGLHLMYSDSVTIEDNELSENSVGVYFMYSKDLTLRRNRLIRNRGPSGYGVGLKDTDSYRVEHNLFVGNRAGIYLDDSPFTHATRGEIRANTFGYNDVGVIFLPSARGNVVSGNNFIDNLEQVSVQGRGELRDTEFAANDRGNFWSDYVGYDLDNNGVGEFEHESQRLFENLLDREPKLRLLLFSPAQQAVEFVGRALPAIRPEPKFFDPAPLVRPVSEAGAPRNQAASAWGLALAGVGMLGVGAGVLALAVPIRIRHAAGASLAATATGGVS